METKTMADKSVIVISDDETETGIESPGADCKNSSVLLLEENSDFGSVSDENRSDEMVDAEFGLSITYSRKAEVMPHARYDCTSHVFCQSENQTSRPVGTNSDFCEQCYCYICDKLASECQSWITPSFCHCNAHKRSPFWKSWRDKALIGALIVFKFDLLEIDADLRHAESLLMKFDADLTVEHDKFMMGTVSSLAAIYSCSCCCHNQYQTMVNCKRCSSKHEAILIYNYSNVYQLVLEFLEKANGEKPKTFAVVLLGAAQRILLHKQPLGHSMPNTRVVPEAVPLLLQRIIEILQRLLVVFDFPSSFSKKLIDFYKSLFLPPYCRCFLNCLNVYLWEDSLLVSVLRGQNITGERVVKGKKEVLFESIHVVLARTEKLREQNKYRELARYLKVVRTNNRAELQRLKDLIPFFMCKHGDFTSAGHHLFHSHDVSCCTACRLTPRQFTMYLKILRTGQVPVGNEPFYSGVWETPTGHVPVKKSDVIKVGLRILNCNAQLYMNPDSWADLIQASCSDSKLARDGSFICVTWKEPEEEFQQRIRETADLVLKELETKQIIILPKQFYSNHFPDEAMLMLVTQALVQRLIHAHMCTVLNIAMAFRRNMWALKYLFKSLSVRHDVLHAFLDCLIKDLNEKNNTLLIRTLPQSDAEHVGHFIFFLISYEHAVLRPVAHRIVDFLLEHWNDFQNCPWQRNLATLLQNQDATCWNTSNSFLQLKNKLRIV
ncbi:hypothetical protein HHUSO_G16123 [Huso huso]|uniref:Uncharacterized protein n=1 Tax=Huso huso TaxID=61971 RepID=A0ABR0ZA03_HUSHU